MATWKFYEPRNFQKLIREIVPRAQIAMQRVNKISIYMFNTSFYIVEQRVSETEGGSVGNIQR